MLTEIDLSILPILWRTGLATFLGYTIGWERRATGAPVRARTLGLVAMTSAALTSLTFQMGVTEAARVIAGLLTGIGFIGAGVIMRGSSGEVRGLTTAASLWAICAISIFVGAGYEGLGILLTLFVYVVLAWDDWPLVAQLRKPRQEKEISKGEEKQKVETPKES